MKLDPRLDALQRVHVLVLVSQPVKRTRVQFRDGADNLHFPRLLRLQQLLAAVESGGIKVRDVLAHVVGAAPLQRELDTVMRHVRIGQCFGRHRDARQIATLMPLGFAGVRRGQIGHEDIAPAKHLPFGNDVAHVENRVRKLLLENARLDVGGQLGGYHLVQRAVGFVLRPGRQPERRKGGNGKTQRRQRQHGSNHRPAGNSRGAHSGDFPVAGHAAQSDQRAHQHSQGNSVGKRKRNGQQKQTADGGRRRRTAHHDLKQLAQPL